ncbi:2'-5' RNA ligase family protein [Streptomyces noursei]|uniref:2'-5' RNA ligase family protein n=1 Tax=Streptomyces noursei TaxID=1971 RepID=UPI003817836C
MEDFFANVENRRHAWPAGRRDLHWHLLPDPAVVHERLVEPYRELTHRPGLEPVPARWLHVTVLHSGPQQEASPQEVEAITTRVRKAVAATGSIELTFARPSIGTQAVECAARPGAAARRLWETTWTATTEVVGPRWPLVPATYHPHTTLAYAAGRDAQHLDRGQLKAHLSDLDTGEVSLFFSQLALVAQWHDGRHIIWEHLTDIPLT